MSPQQPIAVMDLDGVLADVRHRLHHLDRRPKDWDAFFAGAAEDPPLDEGLKLAGELGAGHELVYVTGRPERCRSDTEGWLRRHGLPPGRVVMRSDGDRRPARIVKSAVLAGLARTAAVAVVVDDDPEVCAALRAAGHPVREARWMDASPVLREAQEDQGRT